MRSDGYVFFNYQKRPDGRKHANWMSPETYQRRRVGQTLNKARSRARSKGIPFDIDVDYLLEIYPADGLCPALGTPMTRGPHDGNSPSLDRTIPPLGYVRGNVAWLSVKANTIKSNATTEELFAVANYLKG